MTSMTVMETTEIMEVMGLSRRCAIAFMRRFPHFCKITQKRFCIPRCDFTKWQNGELKLLPTPPKPARISTGATARNAKTERTEPFDPMHPERVVAYR